MFDIFDIRKQSILVHSQRTFETFENVMNETIKELNSKLADLESQYDFLSKEIENNKTEDAYDEMLWNLDEIYLVKDYLLAVEEMKIIYLFKTLEIRIKTLIKIAYPDKDFKENYKWDMMKNIFKNFDIDITVLDGYTEAFNLNTINNRIKHSGEISNEIKKINEFKDSTEFEFEDLRIFHNRVRIKIADFSKALGQAIITELFHFDDKRLNSICVSYIDRMDIETAKKFIDIFNSTLNVKSEQKSKLAFIKNLNG